MFEPITDLSDARILISNDDGIHAPGIKLLEEVALTLSNDVWVIAPESEQSGAGHSLTLHSPLRYRMLDDRHYAVAGTPTDAVLLGVNKLVEGRRPTLLLSGVNRGRTSVTTSPIPARSQPPSREHCWAFSPWRYRRFSAIRIRFRGKPPRLTRPM